MEEKDICSFCGEEIEKDVEKCPHCGEMFVKDCPYCGEKIKIGAIKCKHCGEFLNEKPYNKEELPPELKKFNWGAFLSTWIWGVFNKSFYTLWIIPVCFIVDIIRYFYKTADDPIIAIVGLLFNLIVSLSFLVWFGIKGNEWAWKNKKWKSPEHFNKIQRRWAIWSVVLSIIMIITLVVVGVMFTAAIISEVN